MAAVRAAALSGQLEVDQLAAVLYRAGGASVGLRHDARWATQLTDLARRAAEPGLDPYTMTRTEAWNSWSVPGVDPAGLEHKIYVSPTVAALPHALPIVFARNAELHVPAWKVGANAPGLYRADKIVCYFATPAAALRTGQRLAQVLSGVPARACRSAARSTRRDSSRGAATSTGAVGAPWCAPLSLGSWWPHAEHSGPARPPNGSPRPLSTPWAAPASTSSTGTRPSPNRLPHDRRGRAALPAAGRTSRPWRCRPRRCRSAGRAAALRRNWSPPRPPICWISSGRRPGSPTP